MRLHVRSCFSNRVLHWGTATWRILRLPHSTCRTPHNNQMNATTLGRKPRLVWSKTSTDWLLTSKLGEFVARTITNNSKFFFSIFVILARMGKGPFGWGHYWPEHIPVMHGRIKFNSIPGRIRSRPWIPGNRTCPKGEQKKPLADVSGFWCSGGGCVAIQALRPLEREQGRRQQCLSNNFTPWKIRSRSSHRIKKHIFGFLLFESIYNNGNAPITASSPNK